MFFTQDPPPVVGDVDGGGVGPGLGEVGAEALPLVGEGVQLVATARRHETVVAAAANAGAAV